MGGRKGEGGRRGRRTETKGISKVGKEVKGKGKREKGRQGKGQEGKGEKREGRTGSE